MEKLKINRNNKLIFLKVRNMSWKNTEKRIDRNTPK